MRKSKFGSMMINNNRNRNSNRNVNRKRKRMRKRILTDDAGMDSNDCDVQMVSNNLQLLKQREIELLNSRDSFIKQLELKYIEYFNALFTQKLLVIENIKEQYKPLLNNIRNAIYTGSNHISNIRSTPIINNVISEIESPNEIRSQTQSQCINTSSLETKTNNINVDDNNDSIRILYPSISAHKNNANISKRRKRCIYKDNNKSNSKKNNRKVTKSNERNDTKICRKINKKDEHKPLHKRRSMRLRNQNKINSSKCVDVNAKYKVKVNRIRSKDERQYKCDYCNYKARYMREIQDHERTHTGEKPFKCNKCSTCFRRQCDLNRHQKQHCKMKTKKT
eukprot:214381_1